eukprot:683801-Pyramimonas_sp.AAC.2
MDDHKLPKGVRLSFLEVILDVPENPVPGRGVETKIVDIVQNQGNILLETKLQTQDPSLHQRLLGDRGWVGMIQRPKIGEERQNSAGW